MRPWFLHTGNPSAIHAEGVVAREAIEASREELARTLRVRASEITYTSGGTESNNLALQGVVRALRTAGRKNNDIEILSTKIEHPSILETLRLLEAEGVGVRYVAVDADGQIDRTALRAALSEKTALVTFAYANSEIGTVQEVKKLTRIVRKWNTENGKNVMVHLDASQAPLWLPCQMDMLGVDLMTLDGGKCGGPVGSGVLVHRHTAQLSSVLQGGNQESGLRGGTENTPLIIGCTHAIISAQHTQSERSEKVKRVRERGIELIEGALPNAVLNGPRNNRIANNINISLPGLDTEFAVIVLDQRGIAASTKSACGGADSKGSHVVKELTSDEARARSTVRFTLGEETTESDMERVAQTMKEHALLMRHH